MPTASSPSVVPAAGPATPERLVVVGRLAALCSALDVDIAGERVRLGVVLGGGAASVVD
jgi:hypothetical protein